MFGAEEGLRGAWDTPGAQPAAGHNPGGGGGVPGSPSAPIRVQLRDPVPPALNLHKALSPYSLLSEVAEPFPSCLHPALPFLHAPDAFWFLFLCSSALHSQRFTRAARQEHQSQTQALVKCLSAVLSREKGSWEKVQLKIPKPDPNWGGPAGPEAPPVPFLLTPWSRGSVPLWSRAPVRPWS